MCHETCIEFGRLNLKKEDVAGKSVIEVGSLDVNGSLRPLIETFNPKEYIGADLIEGPKVDLICDANDLLNKFGYERFDLLIATEILEHARAWKDVIHNFKNVLKPDGVLLITTRSKGFKFHTNPFDFWRYEIIDMQNIFSDFNIEVLEKDNQVPGVFLKAKKPQGFTENNLDKYEIYSILRKKKIKDLSKFQYRLFFIIRKILINILPASIKDIIKDKYLR